MMPADLNKRLFELQDETYVVTLLDVWADGEVR
jgi:hypothetical protein